MTIFNQIMYELLTKNVVQKDVLLRTLSPSTYSVYKQLKRAMDKKLIREIKYTVHYGRRQKTIDAICLTSLGVNFIRRKLSADILWTSCIDSSVDKFSVIGSSAKKEILIGRFAKITAAAVMADNIGANECTIFYNDAEQSDVLKLLDGIDSDVALAAEDEDDVDDAEFDAILDELLGEDEEEVGGQEEDSDSAMNTIQQKGRLMNLLSDVVTNALADYASEKTNMLQTR